MTGIDRDAALLEAVRARRMPFREPGFDAVLSEHGLEVSDSYDEIEGCNAVIVTVGTPLRRCRMPLSPVRYTLLHPHC